LFGDFHIRHAVFGEKAFLSWRIIKGAASTIGVITELVIFVASGVVSGVTIGE
jgi:hypothetical protein